MSNGDWYNFTPKKNLTIKELNEVFYHIFKIRQFSENLVTSMPEHLQKHFVKIEIGKGK